MQTRVHVCAYESTHWLIGAWYECVFVLNHVSYERLHLTSTVILLYGGEEANKDIWAQ